MTDLDPGMPDLDAIPTALPPPMAEPDYDSTMVTRGPRRRPKPQRTSVPLWQVVALVLAVQAALVTSAVLVAVERPSVAVSVAAVVLVNIFITVVLARSR